MDELIETIKIIEYYHYHIPYSNNRKNSFKGSDLKKSLISNLYSYKIVQNTAYFTNDESYYKFFREQIYLAARDNINELKEIFLMLKMMKF